MKEESIDLCIWKQEIPENTSLTPIEQEQVNEIRAFNNCCICDGYNHYCPSYIRKVISYEEKTI